MIDPIFIQVEWFWVQSSGFRVANSQKAYFNPNFKIDDGLGAGIIYC